MRHAHVVIVDDDREHVGRRSVRPEQDEIVDFLVGDLHLALDQVVDDGLALARSPDPDDVGLVVRPVRSIAPGAVDLERLALGLGSLARRGQLFLGHVATIGRALFQQLARDLRMAFLELRLEIGFAVPADPEPVQPVEDRVNRFLGRPDLVGVLDPEEIFAAVVPCKQPVEQRGAGTANVEITGR